MSRLGVAWVWNAWNGARDAAQVDGGMGTLHTAVGGGKLHHLGGLLAVAENLDVDARHHCDKIPLAGTCGGLSLCRWCHLHVVLRLRLIAHEGMR